MSTKTLHKLWPPCIFVTVLLTMTAGCGRSPDTPTPMPTLTNTPAPTATPVPTSTPATTATSAPTATHAPGQTRLDQRGIEQVWVPPGSFQMGTSAAAIAALTALNPPGFVLGEFVSEQPEHTVRLTQGYWIDKYEVTNNAFQAFVADGGYQNLDLWSAAGQAWLSQQFVSQLPQFCVGNLPDGPVACVTWYEAEAYAKWRGGRVPTEA